MNIVDIIIILFILMGGVVGFKQGFIRKASSLIGLIIVICLSFAWKNNLSVIMYENLPFFTFGNTIKGIEMYNILFYEFLSFIIIFSVLSIILKVVVSLTGLVEKFLKATIILAIPSKILGAILGLIEYYLYAFIILFFLTLPFFNAKFLENSQMKDKILNNTIVVSKLTEKTMKAYEEISEVVENYKGSSNDEINKMILDILLEYKIITPDSAYKLINQGKIHVSDYVEIISKYKESASI